MSAPGEVTSWLLNALANNDTCLRLLGEGPLDTASERGLNLYRACRWHVGNGDAEWDGEQRICSITEQGRKTLERLEWRLANPEEADARDRAFLESLPTSRMQFAMPLAELPEHLRAHKP